MNIQQIITSGLPSISNIELLPDTHAMLKQKMPAFNFDQAPSSLPENFADMMAEMMIKSRGIGLAANQVGFELRAFCILLDGHPQTLFNPVISELSEDTHKMLEGCLSFPDLYLNISRPSECRLNFQDVRGNRQTILLDDIEARCAMHELDHLNGIVFTSKVSKLQLKMKQKKLQKNR